MKTIFTRTWISDNDVWKIYTRCCEDKNGVFTDILIKRKNKRGQFDWLTQAQKRSMPKYVAEMFRQMQSEVYASRVDYLAQLPSLEGGEYNDIRTVGERHDEAIGCTASKNAFLHARQDGWLLPLRFRERKVSFEKPSVTDSS